MSADQIFIVVTGVIAVLLGAAALVAVLRARDGDAPDGEARAPAEAPDKYDIVPHADEAAARGSYGTAVRVLWWVSIAAVLIGVGLTDAFDASQPAIYLLGAAGVGVVVLTHDLLPSRLRSVPLAVLEVVAALVLITALLALTGYGSSPFAFAYSLVAVAVALAAGGPLALAVAALATLAFLGVLWVDPALPAYESGDLLRLALNVAVLWLLAYLAGVFASGERRVRRLERERSRIDPLTGLFNRGQLDPTLDQEVQRTRRSTRGFCLLMIDLDGLKAVNDTYGHHRGDEVLRSLGGVIRRSIRALDTAYRLGGDEFMVLLPETDIVGAFVVAEKIRLGAEEVGLIAGDGELMTSVSIGLVSCPEDGTSARDLMIAADRAMYQAKSLGKNQISGNPRPHRLTYRPGPMPPTPERPRPGVSALPVGPDAPFGPDAPTRPESAPEPSTADEGVTNPPQPRMPQPPRAEGQDASEEEELDAGEMRRHFATARRNLDPDHQIRRAMDAFLSPSRPNGDPQDQPPPA